jgi:arylsulfatase A-like enzyme
MFDTKVTLCIATENRTMTMILTLAAFLISADQPTAKRPNVVIILADDLGFSDVGCYGGEIETPNLNRLAAGGLRYTQFYNTARCWPTRAALMTGYYPQQVRMDPPAARLPTWAKLLPHYLKSAGYGSYHSGKWHISGAPAVLKDGGFDRSMQIVDYDRNFGPKTRIEDDQKLPPLQPGEKYYSTTAVVDHAIRCLKEHANANADRPFFSYVAFTVPHFPLHAPEADIAKYRKRYLEGWPAIRKRRIERLRQLGIVTTDAADPEPAVRAPGDMAKAKQGLGSDAEKELFYAVDWESLTPEQKSFQADKLVVHAAMVDRMDQEIGRLLKQIEAMKALDDTLIFFLSDNGASAEILVRGDGHDPQASLGSAGSFLCLGPGGSTVCNAPFRRHKMWVHEGGVSTPMIAHWPKGIAARGELRRQVGHLIDFVPTICELAGVALNGTTSSDTPKLPGRSLSPSFAKDLTEVREIYFHHMNNRGLRLGDWKIVADKSGPSAWELYNLAEDRTERHDLAAKFADRVKAMAARWQSLEDEFRKQGYGDLPPDEQLGAKKKKAKKKNRP